VVTGDIRLQEYTHFHKKQVNHNRKIPFSPTESLSPNYSPTSSSGSQISTTTKSKSDIRSTIPRANNGESREITPNPSPLITPIVSPSLSPTSTPRENDSPVVSPRELETPRTLNRRYLSHPYFTIDYYVVTSSCASPLN
jgi:hypothetical protein